jgi:hypothetical protein
VEFAADLDSSRFRDRLYLVWGEAKGDHYVLRFACSKDKGATWSAPQAVAEAAGAEQFRPSIAVNRDGVVGVSWFDSRLANGKPAYDEFFAASLDGGESFLPALRVSQESSRLHPAGNFVFKPTIDSRRIAGSSGNLSLSFTDTDDRFPDEGDYMGMAADAAGAFHPFWSDTRTGSAQAWTAGIIVSDSAARDGRNKPSSVGGPPVATIATPISRKIEVVLDPARLDRASGIEEIPIRIKNISDAPLCTPLTAELTDLSADVGTPEVINSSNGMRSKGALFDYSKSLGDFSCLDPGAVTNAIIWKIRITDPEKSFVSLSFSVSGVEAKSRP